MLLELLPNIYRRFDQSAGLVLQKVFEAFDKALLEFKKDIEAIPDYVDLNEAPDSFVLQILENLANPFRTRHLDKTSSNNIWILGETALPARILSESDEEELFLSVTIDDLRELGSQLYQIYKKKGTKQGILWAVRAVTKRDVFIPALWTDGSMRCSSSPLDRWILGETPIGLISETPVGVNIPPYCHILEQSIDEGAPPPPESYGVPQAVDETIRVTARHIEDNPAYGRYALIEVQVESDLGGAVDLLMQVSNDGGFTWKPACGSWLTDPSYPSDWWVLGETDYGKIVEKDDVTGIKRRVESRTYYFLLDCVETGFAESEATPNLKLRFSPYRNGVLGQGAIPDVFRMYPGDTPASDQLTPDSIPAILNGCPRPGDHWVLGETGLGIISESFEDEYEEKRHNIYHFLVIITDGKEVSDEILTAIREVVNYMKPSHTHYDLIRGDESKGLIFNWKLGETPFGIIHE